MKSSVSHGRAPSTIRLPVLALIAGLSLPLLGGCPGTLSGGPWPQATGSTGGSTGAGSGGTSGGGCDAPAMVFPSCVSAACHLPMGFFPPDLSAAKAGDLKTTNAVTSTAPCVTMPIVNAADKANSPILKRVQGSSCGPQMPNGLPPLPADQIACITSWVTAQ